MFNIHTPRVPKAHSFAWIIAAMLLLPTFANAEWNKDWSSHKKISINSQGISEEIAQMPVLVRLHSGNFDFTSASIDGSDLRFIAADVKD